MTQHDKLKQTNFSPHDFLLDFLTAFVRSICELLGDAFFPLLFFLYQKKRIM